MRKPYYIEDNIFTEEEIKTEKSPLKAIRNHCRYNCCCNDFDSWKNCPNEDCFLFAFRFGKNTNSKRSFTEEQREALRERAKRLKS